MEFTIDKNKFIKILQRVQGIVEKRNTMPILENVLIEAKGGNITVMATDLEIFIKDTSEAKIKKEGTITVKARKVFDIVKELPSDNVDIIVKEGEKVTIKGAKSKYNIIGLPAKEFPAFPAGEEDKLKKVNVDIFKEMVDKTTMAVSTDETRYNINGFYVEKDGGNVKMVTTDGHRLALVNKNAADFSAIEGKAILPKKGISEIRRIVDEDDGEFLFNLGKKSAIIKKGNAIINIRLIEGEFPDYKQVIPKDNDKKVIIDKNIFLDALKRVTLVSSDKIKGTKFVLSKNKLILQSSSQDIGDATEEIEVEYDGTDLEIAFNAKYFTDVLSILNVDKIVLELKDALSPGLLKCTDSSDQVYVIMPMRL